MTQADNTTQTAAITQPVGQQSQALNNEPKDIQTELERARANDKRERIELGVEQLYKEFEQFGDVRTYREGGAVSGEFYMFRFRGTIVTVPPKFKQEFDKGTIQSVVATPTIGPRTVPDPNNAGMTKQELVWGYSITFSGAEALQKELNAKKLAANLKSQMMIQEKHQEALMDAAVKAMTPEKMAAMVKPEDIDALIAAAVG